MTKYIRCSSMWSKTLCMKYSSMNLQTFSSQVSDKFFLRYTSTTLIMRSEAITTMPHSKSKMIKSFSNFSETTTYVLPLFQKELPTKYILGASKVNNKFMNRQLLILFWWRVNNQALRIWEGSLLSWNSSTC